MSANSSKRNEARKPATKLAGNWRQQRGLHPDFALFPHQSGRWAKKVRGKLHYFGKIADDPKGESAALLWAEQKDDLIAGRTPRANRAAMTVKTAVNTFLTDKQRQIESGELNQRTLTSTRQPAN